MRVDDSCADANSFWLTAVEKESIRDALIDICYEPTGGRDYIHLIRMTAYQKFPARLLKKLESLKDDDAYFFLLDMIRFV